MDLTNENFGPGPPQAICQVAKNPLKMGLFSVLSKTQGSLRTCTAEHTHTHHPCGMQRTQEGSHLPNRHCGRKQVLPCRGR